ncbi:hypothetical protein M514_08075, partial [Trichuris suis]
SILLSRFCIIYIYFQLASDSAYLVTRFHYRSSAKFLSEILKMGAQQTKHEATQQTESEERSPVDREPLFESGQSGTQERSPADTEPLLESGQSGTEERGETATYLQKILQVCGQKNVLSWKLFKS